jgi:hypothetical protein
LIDDMTDPPSGLQRHPVVGTRGSPNSNITKLIDSWTYRTATAGIDRLAIANRSTTPLEPPIVVVTGIRHKGGGKKTRQNAAQEPKPVCCHRDRGRSINLGEQITKTDRRAPGRHQEGTTHRITLVNKAQRVPSTLKELT